MFHANMKILLEVEADNGLSDKPGSLMDKLCDGLITATRKYLVHSVSTVNLP